MRMNKATLVRVIACAVFLYFMFVVVTFVRRVPNNNNNKDDNYSSLQYGKSSTTTTTTTIKPPTTPVITTTPTTTTATTATTTTSSSSSSSIYPPFVLLTVNMNNVHLLIEQVLPCVYQTHPNTPIMLFGLNMNNQMTRYLQQLHLVHFVSIPLSKLVLDYDHEALDMESSDLIESWTQLVIKLCKSYPYTFINLHQNGRAAAAAAGEEEPTPEATLLSTGGGGTGGSSTGLFNRINIQSIHMNHWIRKCPNNNNDKSNRMIPFKKLAVIVPFIDRQVDNLLEQIQRWSKPMYAPCTPTTINHNHNHNNNNNENDDDDDDDNNEKKKKQSIKTDLIFFYHKEVNETLQELILSHLSPDTMMCFDKIVFRYARLLPSEDVYPVAANYMFYRLVHDPVIHTQYEYMFYSEPDTWAIRNNWIQVLLDLSFHSTMVPSFPSSSSSLSSSSLSSRRTYRSSSSSLPSSEQQQQESSYAEQYWVKGSIYRGPRRDLGRLSVNIHVNGNAIYHLVDDYLQFLKQVQVGIPVDAYDVAQTRYLFRDPTSLRLYWHKFHFSEFIQNLWQVEWDERQVRMNSVETVFVHGKTKYEPPATKLPPAANHL